MDLKQFVSDSLTQISEGIKDAQSKAGTTGAWISPGGGGLPAGAEAIELGGAVSAYVHDVDFDVAVTVSADQTAGAGAGIKVFGARIGADGKVEYGNLHACAILDPGGVAYSGTSRPRA
jgi:hypothetical protein